MHHELDYDWILCWFLQTKVVPGGCQSTTRSPVMVNWASTKRSLTAWTSIYQVILHTVKCHVNTLKKFQQVFLMHVITLSKWVLKTSIFKWIKLSLSMQILQECSWLHHEKCLEFYLSMFWHFQPFECTANRPLFASITTPKEAGAGSSLSAASLSIFSPRVSSWALAFFT